MTIYAWALMLMASLQPHAPWEDRYTEVAFSIVDAAKAHPLFAGKDAVARTVALAISVAWFESRFDPEAIGDKGESIGLFQINRLHAPRAELLEPAAAMGHFERLAARSRLLCGARPPEESLGWYAGGGAGCGDERARRFSAHRWALASRLFRDHPPPADDATFPAGARTGRGPSPL